MKGSVLIAENETLVREAMEDILSAGGMTTIGTANGQACIEAYRARQEEIALVILDMRMPGMSGPDILKALRQINPAVKAIVSSAYEEQEIRQGFNGEQISLILRKPFSAETLLTSVSDVLAG